MFEAYDANPCKHTTSLINLVKDLSGTAGQLIYVTVVTMTGEQNYLLHILMSFKHLS